MPDLKIDIRDINRVAKAYGSNPVTRTKTWDPWADVNRDGQVDIRDVAIVAKKYNWSAP